jgi:type II secretory pathway component HofQ
MTTASSSPAPPRPLTTPFSQDLSRRLCQKDQDSKTVRPVHIVNARDKTGAPASDTLAARGAHANGGSKAGTKQSDEAAHL